MIAKPPLSLGLCLTVFLLFPRTADAEPLLRSNDRVVFVGGTLIERARLYGHWEAALQVAAGREVTGLSFRNLGWSADSVFGDSRSYFGKPEEGRRRLAATISELKPTVVFLCYGTGEAMSVERGWTNEPGAAVASGAGLEQSLALFRSGYQKKIEAIQNAAAGSVREIVLIAPPPLENLGPPLPDQVGNNRTLARFRDAIADLAEKNETRFVDLFAARGGDEFDGRVAVPPLTDNGVHPTAEGYAVLARALLEALGYEATEALSDGANQAALREAITEKNRLFFHRWRPANETYLFLFRKHEQGQNAKEIPMF
ncbi:MAG: SGNH/GDSL hydrolase family protein, partial [Planctomycetota bacterium]